MRSLNPTTPRPHEASTIFDIAARLEQNYQRLLSILTKLESTEPNAQCPTPKAELAAMAEIRKHIALAERALATAVEAHAVDEFKQTVLHALAQSSQTVQKRVLTILSRRKPT